MFCSNCGSKNEEGSLFCLQCGSKLESAKKEEPKKGKDEAAKPKKPAKPADKKPKEPAKPKPKPAPAQPAPAQPAPEQPAAQPAPAPEQPAAQPAPAQPAQDPAQQQATMYNPQANGPIPPVDQVPVQEGCIGAAWRDITSSKGWFGRSLLLGLLNAIPVINFGVTGYTEQWGVDVAKGKREVMPKIHFNNRSLISGIFEFAAWTVYSLILIAAMILTTVIFAPIPVLPILIGIAWFVFGFFYHGYVSLASMKSALKMDFGVSYETKNLWKSYKKKPGTLVGAYLVPSIVCKAITFVLVLIFLGILFATVSSIGASAMSSVSKSAASSYDPFATIGTAFSGIMAIINAALGIGIIGVVCIIIVVMLLAGFEKLWRYRAVGHWIARYAPEWVTEEDKNMKYLRI